MDKKLNYHGKPIQDYTKEELIEIVCDFVNKLEYERSEKLREGRFLRQLHEHKKRRY